MSLDVRHMTFLGLLNVAQKLSDDIHSNDVDITISNDTFSSIYLSIS